jgi:hypothetical protein
MTLCRKLFNQCFKQYLAVVTIITLILSGIAYAHPDPSSLIDMKAFTASQNSILPKGAKVIAGHVNEFVITEGLERQGDVKSHYRMNKRHHSLVKLATIHRGQHRMRA